MRVGMWHLTDDGPQRLESDQVSLEQHLESWIERDPNLVMAGLEIIGRQIGVDGGRIDLLAIDVTGDFVVIEIKRGALYRETLAQGLDYTECIASMSVPELERLCGTYLSLNDRDLHALLAERDALDQLGDGRRRVWLCLVGTGVQPRLTRLAEYLEDAIRITFITFNVFTIAPRQQVLVRELTERDDVHEPRARRPQEPTSDGASAVAAASGIGEGFDYLKEVALRLGLYPRVYRKSIMFTPPTQRNRMLFTIWTTPVGGKLKAYVSPRAVAEFYPVSEHQAQRALGAEGFRYLDGDDARSLGRAYDQLLARERSVISSTSE
jgi:Holliday junction resolvase-like predicted endonuclease